MSDLHISWEEYRKNIREWIGKAGKQNIPTILQSERQKISMMQSQPMQMQPQPMIYQPMQIQQNKTLPMQIQQNKTLPMQIQQNKSMPMRSPV